MNILCIVLFIALLHYLLHCVVDFSGDEDEQGGGGRAGQAVWPASGEAGERPAQGLLSHRRRGDIVSNSVTIVLNSVE